MNPNAQRAIRTHWQLWNEILKAEIIKAVKRRDFEFAYFLSEQLFTD